MIYIARARKKAGLTQKDLQDRLGMKSNATVSQWESGKRMPRADILPRIADILGCTVDELVRPNS